MNQIELPAWAIERGRRLNSFDRIDPARTALIAIDLQIAFTLAGEVFGNANARDIIPNVNRLANAMRAAGGHVLWTRQTVTRELPYAYPEWQYDATDPFVARAIADLTDGAASHQLHEALEVHPDDIVRLAALNVDMLIITGTLTNVCCESSARDAYMLGYKVLFASDATAAVSDAEHNAALTNLRLNFADVKSTDALIALIEAGV